MKTTRRLYESVKNIWAQYDAHPFVTGIRDGSLDREKFRFYIIQDYLYLEEYAKTFAVGIAKARCPETTQIFSHYLRMLTGDEMDIHRGYMGRFGSYEVIARNMVEVRPEAVNDPFYGDWVKGYVSDRYARDNVVLLDAMDRLSADYSEAKLQHLEEIFVACSRYELAFWQMAWDMRL